LFKGLAIIALAVIMSALVLFVAANIPWDQVQAPAQGDTTPSGTFSAPVSYSVNSVIFTVGQISAGLSVHDCRVIAFVGSRAAGSAEVSGMGPMITFADQNITYNVFFYDADANSVLNAGDAFILFANANLPPATSYKVALVFLTTGAEIAESSFLTEPVIGVG
jgi:hypothetical protein